jgi:predicted dehydrogenase
MNSEKMLRAAVIGLGNIGFQFDLDPLRKNTWSHVGAYTKCRETRLAGTVEVDRRKIDLFKQYKKNIPVFSSIKDLMENVKSEVVSVCTPTDTHYDVLKDLLQYSFLKGIFCEKPFTATIAEAREIIRLCSERNVIIAVNHTRRWDSTYLRARKIIRDGNIGTVKAVNGFYSGKLFNIGTHLFDTIRMLIDEEALSVSGISPNIDASDPDISGWIRFGEKTFCTILSNGKREDLIFEIDVIGDEGRVKVLENGERLELYKFRESKRYSAYRELAIKSVRLPEKRDRLVDAIYDLCAVIKGKKMKSNCSGEDGLASIVLSAAFYDSAKRNGMPVELREYNAE